MVYFSNNCHVIETFCMFGLDLSGVKYQLIFYHKIPHINCVVYHFKNILGLSSIKDKISELKCLFSDGDCK